MASYSWKKIPRNGSSYSDDDDIDDEEFLKQGQRNGVDNLKNLISSSHEDQSLEQRRQELLLKKKEIEQRTIRSTEQSLSYLRSSEEIGVATAEELMRQREQLERTEKRLDDINSTLRFSQRHIQGIKSIFGGLKNLINGKTLPQQKEIKMPARDSSSSSSQGTLSETLKSSNFETVHPGLRIRGQGEELHSSVSSDGAPQDIVDENLSHMLNSITKLKGLARGLGDEIESQNDLLDNITEKTERADTSLHKQNKEINKLLK